MANFENLTIEDALSKEPADQDAETEVTCSFIAKVLNKSETVKYTNAEGKPREYIILYVADARSETTVRLYRWKTPSPEIGTTYLFKNLIRKDLLYRNEPFLGRYDTPLIEKPDIEVPDDVGRKSKDRQYEPLGNSTRQRTLSDAIYADDNSTLTGKIVKMSGLSKVTSDDNSTSIDMRHLALIDKDGMTPCKVTLFGQNAIKNYRENEVVKVTSVYWRQLAIEGKEPGFCSRKISQSDIRCIVTFVRDEQSSKFTVMSTTKSVDDPDFDIQVEDVTINAVQEVYLACHKIIKVATWCQGRVQRKSGVLMCNKCHKPRQRSHLSIAAIVNVTRGINVNNDVILTQTDICMLLGVTDSASPGGKSRREEIKQDLEGKVHTTHRASFVENIMKIEHN